MAARTADDDVKATAASSLPLGCLLRTLAFCGGRPCARVRHVEVVFSRVADTQRSVAGSA